MYNIHFCLSSNDRKVTFRLIKDAKIVKQWSESIGAFQLGQFSLPWDLVRQGLQYSIEKV